MLDLLEQGCEKQMTFFFGAVKARDLYYVDLFTQLAEEYANFHYIPALSDPDPEDDWQGEVGLITEVVARRVKDGRKQSLSVRESRNDSGLPKCAGANRCGRKPDFLRQVLGGDRVKQGPDLMRVEENMRTAPWRHMAFWGGSRSLAHIIQADGSS